MIISPRSVLITATLMAASAAASGSTDLSIHHGDSGIDLSWATLPGIYYAIEKSTSLQAWETVQSGILAEGNSAARTVPEPADYPVFYRIRDNAFVDLATPANAQPFLANPTGDNWVLEFSDEFNGTEVDTTKWTINISTRSRAARPTQGINDWWWKPSNVSVANGVLVLDVIKHDHNTMYCGSIYSKGKYEPTYGYLEARIQIADTTKSTHTAFWLQGENMSNVDGTGNDGAEVDIFESAWFGDYTKSVVHIDGYGSAHKANTKKYNTPGLHNGYHVFGLEWNASGMKIYYDGVLKVSYTGIWVPQVPEFLWLSDGASFGDVGTFTSEPNGWLTAAKVDYVRVWRSR
ncbi:MAG: family 16 glycosylhydrolase [Puniceicoccaceae bacterium]